MNNISKIYDIDSEFQARKTAIVSDYENKRASLQHEFNLKIEKLQKTISVKDTDETSKSELDEEKLHKRLDEIAKKNEQSFIKKLEELIELK